MASSTESLFKGRVRFNFPYIDSWGKYTNNINWGTKSVTLNFSNSSSSDFGMFSFMQNLGDEKLFKTPDEAAKDFGQKYNKKSIDENVEYLTLIVTVKKDNKTYYTYLDPGVGDGFSTNQFKPSQQDLKRTVADAHTHGKWVKESYDYSTGKDWNNTFSDADIAGNKKFKIDGYVATPSGTLLKYTLKTKQITTISNKLPFDKNKYKSRGIIR